MFKKSYYIGDNKGGAKPFTSLILFPIVIILLSINECYFTNARCAITSQQHKSSKLLYNNFLKTLLNLNHMDIEYEKLILAYNLDLMYY